MEASKIEKTNLLLIQVRKYIILIVLIVLSGIGAAFSLKAAVGVGAWDAMTQSIAFLTDSKVGTVGIFLNCLCLIGQILILRKEFKSINLLQIPVSLILGLSVNYFLYNILNQFTITNYFINLLILVCSYLYLSIVVSAIMTLNLVTFSLEGFCMAIAQKTNQSFGKIRLIADLFSVTVVVIQTFFFSQPVTLREGTIISMVMFGPLLNYFMPKINKLFKRWELIN